METPKRPVFCGPGEHSVHDLENICQQNEHYINYLLSDKTRAAAPDLAEALILAFNCFKQIGIEGDDLGDQIKSALNKAGINL